mmetsp:Transcript_8202/g.17915  ORF Transcript_8202/g.17915 Transcript_8202/m.17915 type:complete len:204 (-) Transcript_8202:1029-1640(-)
MPPGWWGPSPPTLRRASSPPWTKQRVQLACTATRRADGKEWVRAMLLPCREMWGPMAWKVPDSSSSSSMHGVSLKRRPTTSSGSSGRLRPTARRSVRWRSALRASWWCDRSPPRSCVRPTRAHLSSLTLSRSRAASACAATRMSEASLSPPPSPPLPCRLPATSPPLTPRSAATCRQRRLKLPARYVPAASTSTRARRCESRR